MPRTDPHSRAPGLAGLARDAIMAAVHGVRRVLASPSRLDEMEARMAGNEQQLRELAGVFADGLGSIKALIDSLNAKVKGGQEATDAAVSEALARDAAEDGAALAAFTEDVRAQFAQVASGGQDAGTVTVPDAPAPTPNDDQVPAPSDTTDAGQNPPPPVEVAPVADDSGAAPVQGDSTS